MKPTIGRIVHYTLTQQDADTINRARSGRATRDRIDVQNLGNRAEAGQTYPATIARIFDPTQVNPACNLQVTLDGVDSHWATSRTEGTGDGHWTWPPRN